MVRAPAAELRPGRSATPRARGEAAILSLRPERLSINPPEGMTENRFEARIVEVIYFGAHNRVRLAMAGRDDVVARVPAGAGSDTLLPGAPVTIGWSSEHCRVLAPA